MLAAMLLELILLIAIVYIEYTTMGDKQYGQFIPVTPNTALDTRTGRLCWSYDPIGGGDKIPACEKVSRGRR